MKLEFGEVHTARLIIAADVENFICTSEVPGFDNSPVDTGNCPSCFLIPISNLEDLIKSKEITLGKLHGASILSDYNDKLCNGL
jgi:hypothetical protein